MPPASRSKARAPDGLTWDGRLSANVPIWSPRCRAYLDLPPGVYGTRRGLIQSTVPTLRRTSSDLSLTAAPDLVSLVRLPCPFQVAAEGSRGLVCTPSAHAPGPSSLAMTAD